MWVRGLLDVRIVRGGRSSSGTSRGPEKTRYGGRETTRATRLTVSQLALELGAAPSWDVVARAQLNWDPDGYNDDRLLLIEAYLRKEWGEWGQGWEVQTGIMNLPFSLEHTGPAWTPQYTLTPSAFNSWLWEEGHLVGLEGEWWRVIQSRLRLGRLVGSGFGQDQAGHLLAVRGWVLSDALHGVNSDLPLPIRGQHVPAFDEQDNRPSIYAWLTVRDLRRQAELGIGYFDNLADQYELGVWGTRFGTLGVTLHPLPQVDFVSQYLIGEARHRPCRCGVSFHAFYALLSWHHRSHRISARYDVFRTNNQDDLPNYRDHGDAVTLAYLFEFGLQHRVGFEYVFVRVGMRNPFLRRLLTMGGNSATGFGVRKNMRALLKAITFIVALSRGSWLALVDCSFAVAGEINGRVIGPDGEGIAQAVVFVQTLPAGVSSKAPLAATHMDQLNEQFAPTLLPIPVGTKGSFPNQDQIHHHVYSFSRTKRFEIPLYRGEEEAPIVLDKEGVVKVGCNIHDRTAGIILVVPTRFYAVTAGDGSFTLRNLPDGTYPLVSWHERSQTAVEETLQQVLVDEQVPNVTFSLTLKFGGSRRPIRGSRGYR